MSVSEWIELRLSSATESSARLKAPEKHVAAQGEQSGEHHQDCEIDDPRRGVAGPQRIVVDVGWRVVETDGHSAQSESPSGREKPRQLAETRAVADLEYSAGEDELQHDVQHEQRHSPVSVVDKSGDEKAHGHAGQRHPDERDDDLGGTGAEQDRLVGRRTSKVPKQAQKERLSPG